MRKDSFKEFVLDQLRDLDDVTCRAMFGGHGLYRGDAFFGIISESRLYFKTDDSSRAQYRARAMKPFRASATQTLKNYYEVPVEILEDAEQLCRWATDAATLPAVRSARRRQHRTGDPHEA